MRPGSDAHDRDAAGWLDAMPASRGRTSRRFRNSVTRVLAVDPVTALRR
jgi:hypothetical protein